MAKNDKKKTEQLANEQRGLVQTPLNNLRNEMGTQSQQAQNDYRSSLPGAQADYDSIMSQFRNFQASPATQRYDPERVNYQRSAELNSALQGYQNFANTGGFSEQDLGALRARGISPIQAVYQNSRNELDRQRAIQGGYSPNYTASLAKMSGQLGSSIADQTQRVNAALAEMVQQGKQFGLGGLGNLSVQDLNFAQNAALANQNAGLQAAHLNATNIDPLRLSAIQGQASLFGQTPGMASMFANQLNQANQNRMNVENLQQGASQGAMQGRALVNQTPSNFETGMGRVGQIANMASSAAMPFFTGGTSNLLQSRRLPGMNNINSGMFSAPGIR